MNSNPDNISAYDYDLPDNLIAQTPANPRESAQLMVLDKQNHSIVHQHISDLPDYFKSGDVIVVNNTKVFKARLYGAVNGINGAKSQVELFLLRPLNTYQWLALGKPGKKFKPGIRIDIGPDFTARVIDYRSDGTMDVEFKQDPKTVIRLSNQYGHVPVPPYIKTEPDATTYQTVYARVEGSVAAPTAGFHLTPTIISRLRKKGVIICEITLHVGLGTFLPIKTSHLTDHHMHSEWVSINRKTAEYINQNKIDKRRIIAIGTTTVRTLEGVAMNHNGKVQEYSGDINLFITPGFQFQIINGMLTNFHLPKSTLIVLVSAFAGRELILQAYHEAIKRRYRFYSFGDAMLII
jgi:S-adenosylmethionine:tRNA ribosyltransferase-isomerase